jgi:hypothetical protein
VSDGQPCGQRLGTGRQCIWHPETATEAEAIQQRRLLALRGSQVAALNALRILPEDTKAPRWRSRSQIVGWLEEQARLVGIGSLDPRIAAEMRQSAELALRAYELEALEKLDSYERVIAGKARRIG